MAGEGAPTLSRDDGGIDWDLARRQVASNEERLRRVLTGDAALFTWVMELRAAELARPADTGQPAGAPFLTVRGASAHYALPLHRVRHIAPLPVWTPLPGAAPHILGLAQCGGERHLVLDVDAMVNGAAATPADGGLAVLLRDRRVALRVAAVEGIADYADAASPPIGRHVRSVADDGTALLDIDTILQRAHWGREA